MLTPVSPARFWFVHKVGPLSYVHICGGRGWNKGGNTCLQHELKWRLSCGVRRRIFAPFATPLIKIHFWRPVLKNAQVNKWVLKSWKWRCIHQGHQNAGINLQIYHSTMERSNMAAVGSKKQMGFRCIHVMIISKYTFVEFLNEMESCLRILDCRSLVGKCLHAFGRRLNDYNSAAARNYNASANEMNALLSGSKGKFTRLPSYFFL